jgi:hypothetical protein
MELRDSRVYLVLEVRRVVEVELVVRVFEHSRTDEFDVGDVRRQMRRVLMMDGRIDSEVLL